MIQILLLLTVKISELSIFYQGKINCSEVKIVNNKKLKNCLVVKNFYIIKSQFAATKNLLENYNITILFLIFH